MIIDYSEYKKEGYRLIKNIANNVKIDSHQITLFYEDDDDITETIEVHHIGYLDYFYLKEAYKNISKEELEVNETIEILGPFNIKKESSQYSINSTNDHITQEELISIQSDLIVGEGGSING